MRMPDLLLWLNQVLFSTSLLSLVALIVWRFATLSHKLTEIQRDLTLLTEQVDNNTNRLANISGYLAHHEQFHPPRRRLKTEANHEH
jgi:hypothetical protein